jgi:hypothetical protein
MKKNLMETTDFLDKALKIAEKVCKTDLCPIQFKNKPNEALAAMLYGKELNFGPMQSLNCINIINGKASLSIDALLGLAQAHPEWNGIENKQLGTQKDGKCSADYGWKVVVSRMGKDGKAKFYTETFTVKDAVRANLWDKGAWKTYPDRMLKIRATGFALRTAFQDAIKGTIDTVEAQDYDSIPSRSIKPPINTNPKITVQSSINQKKDADDTKNVEFRPIQGNPEKMSAKRFLVKIRDTWQIIYQNTRLKKEDKLKKIEILKELNSTGLDILETEESFTKDFVTLKEFYNEMETQLR